MKIECPYCHQPYEIDEKLIGQDLECGICKKKFTVSVTTPLQPIEVKTNVKQGAVIGAWVCLILGILLNIFTNFLLIIFLPLYLAAFVLSIVAMAQRRIGWGLASLLLTIILPPIIFLVNIGRFADEVNSAMQEKSTPEVAMQEKAGGKTSAAAKPADKKEIFGLCGIEFGSFFSRNNNPRNGKLTSGEIMYAVNPLTKFMGFTDYYVLITPASEKVYSIWMRQEFENSAEGRAEFDKVAAVLENHYKIKGEKEFSIDPVMVFRFDNGRIVLKLDIRFRKSALEIRGYSTEFEDLNEQEKKETAVRTTDTSAL